VVIHAVVQSEQYILLSLALRCCASTIVELLKLCILSSPNQNWFSMQIPSQTNGYLISTTLITVLFMAKPDYVTTWLIS
jgi:hypothetical protein